MRYKLADKTVYHVRNSLFILLCGFQSLYTCRVSRRIFSRGGIIGGCTLHGDGICVELLNERRCRLHAGTGCGKRFNHISSICAYCSFPFRGWRRIYSVGHPVVIRSIICCDTTCCRGYYPYNGYSSQRSGLFQ